MTFSLGYAFAGLMSGRLERIPPWIVMTTALLLGGFGTTAMGAIGNLTVFIAVALVAGLGLGICWSYTSVVTQSVVPREQAGAAAGTVLTVLISIGGVGLAIAVSILDAHIQSGASNEAEVIDNVVIASGALAVVAAPFVALLGRQRRDRCLAACSCRVDGPVVLRIAAGHLAAHLAPRPCPEARQVGGHLDGAPGG